MLLFMISINFLLRLKNIKDLYLNWKQFELCYMQIYKKEHIIYKPVVNSRQTIEIDAVWTLLQVHRPNIVSYMSIHWAAPVAE